MTSQSYVNHRTSNDPVKASQVFGVAFAELDVAAAVRLLAARPPEEPFAYVATPNAVHIVGVDRGEVRFVSGVGGAWLRTCDSQVVRLLARLLFQIELPLAPGSDITEILFENEIASNEHVCLIGGSPEMAAALRQRFGLARLSQHIPPQGFTHQPAAVEACVDFVCAHPARYVFLACGAPQSEALGWRIVERGGATGIGLCIGASLLFLTGMLRRAPPIWRRWGLEWLYRLIQEPRRLFRRLLTGQLPFLWVAMRYRLLGR